MLNGTPILPANEVHANDQVQNSLDGITSDLGAVGRVLVCVRGDAQSEELARYTRNLADRLGASWMATPLPGKRSSRCKTPELERINAVLRLVEALGGKAVRIPLSGRVADNLISFANKNNVAHIVLAKSEHERWYEYSVVRDLMHRAGRIRLHLINEHSPLIGHVKPIVTPAGESWIATLAPYLWAGIAVAAAVMLAKGIGTLVGTSRIAHVEVVLLTSIVAVAVRYGLAASLLATALACFCFDFFFLPPLYSLAIDDPFDVTAFLLFSIVGVIVSNLAARLRAQTHANIDRLHVIEALYSVSHELTAAANLQDVATVASRRPPNCFGRASSS